MRMSEAEFLNRLNKAFPEKVIFAEQSRLSEYLSLFVEIRRYARGAGVSSVQLNKRFSLCHIAEGKSFWYARLDSNQRPTESESVTLSN